MLVNLTNNSIINNVCGGKCNILVCTECTCLNETSQPIGVYLKNYIPDGLKLGRKELKDCAEVCTNNLHFKLANCADEFLLTIDSLDCYSNS